MDGGYFKLHRSIFNCWEWNALSHEGRSVMLTLLSMANWSAGAKYDRAADEWYTVPRGSFIATQDEIAIAAKVSRNAVRSALKILLSSLPEELPFLYRKSTRGSTLYTIVKYSEYQDDAELNTKELPENHQAEVRAEVRAVAHHTSIIRNKEDIAPAKKTDGKPSPKNQLAIARAKKFYDLYVERLGQPPATWSWNGRSLTTAKQLIIAVPDEAEYDERLARFFDDPRMLAKGCPFGLLPSAVDQYRAEDQGYVLKLGRPAEPEKEIKWL
jgi:hypothetical protein